MGRKRYVQLTSEQEAVLTDGYKTGRKHYFRSRCHCILLSSRGKSVSELMVLFSARKHTIYDWFNRWEAEGINGLKIRSGRGRKRKLDIDNQDHISLVKKSLSQENRNLNQLKNEVEAQLGFTISKISLRRFLKSLVTGTKDFENA